MDALVETTYRERRYAPLAIRYAKDVLSQFTQEDWVYRQLFSTSLARAHFLNGEPEEGEAVCRALIAESPARACGYVTLADALVGPTDGPRDYDRAIALLEEALAVPVEDAAGWDIPLRLERLREERKTGRSRPHRRA
jgi:hypothetical protein